MICSCGGFTETKVFRGEAYQVCRSCGRADPPEGLEEARELAVWIRGRYDPNAEGPQSLVISEAIYGKPIDEQTICDALDILGEDYVSTVQGFTLQ